MQRTHRYRYRDLGYEVGTLTAESDLLFLWTSFPSVDLEHPQPEVKVVSRSSLVPFQNDVQDHLWASKYFMFRQ